MDRQCPTAQRHGSHHGLSANLVVLTIALTACGPTSTATRAASGGAAGGAEGVGGSAGRDATTTPADAGGATLDAGGDTDAAAVDDGSSSACPSSRDVQFSDAPSLKATGFTNGTIAPYTICTTQNPNYGQPFTLDSAPAMKFFWTQVGYDGTRQDRGAEACSALAIYKEGWYGLKFYLPTPGFPSDKTQTIAQVFANGGCSSWAAMLEVRNNELWIVYRGNCVATPQYQVMLASDIPRNAWNPVVIHFITSNQNAGAIEIWYGDAVCTRDVPTHRNFGINFAFGTWTGDTLTADPANSIGLKFGMYNFDDANYTVGETRTIYYDQVSQLDGAPTNAWETVNPGR
jgi:hypothetical protein